jgi:4-diphosphocytidyl-2-C-methyl-D-erythritol kinase
MISERHSGAVFVWAPAKVNLFLEVLAKRDDGYHEIATLMATVSLFDTLEFRANSSGRVVLQCDHPSLDPGPANLIVRAAELLRARRGSTGGADISLRKRIPLEAGLAGGSSNAAAALTGLNALWELGLTGNELSELGGQLGSDVPFFFATPAAWCTGRGEIVHPLISATPFWLVLLCPHAGLSTATVYQNVAVPDRPLSGAEARQALASGDVNHLANALHNRLEEPAARLCPSVEAARARLRAANPAGVRMSGSGSAVYALCRDRSEAVRIAREIRTGPDDGPPPNVMVVRTCP